MLKAYRFYDTSVEQGVTFFETRNGNYVRVFTPLDMAAYQGYDKVGADWSPWTGWVYSNPAVEEYTEYPPRLSVFTPNQMAKEILELKDLLVSISTVEEALYITGVYSFSDFFRKARMNIERRVREIEEE